MNIIELLEQKREDIVADATDALVCARLHHYEQTPVEHNRERIEKLYTLVIASLRHGRRDIIAAHAQTVAHERFDARYSIREVQLGFHVLEEAIWDHLLDALEPREFASAIALVKAVIDAGTDSLAGAWVAQASRTGARPVEIGELWKGTDCT